MSETLTDLIREAKAAWDRNDGIAYTVLRAKISQIERTAFSSLTQSA